jgi:hypothetical protein
MQTDACPSIARAHKSSLASVASFQVRIAPDRDQDADIAGVLHCATSRNRHFLTILDGVRI